MNKDSKTTELKESELETASGGGYSPDDPVFYHSTGNEMAKATKGVLIGNRGNDFHEDGTLYGNR